MEELLTHEQVNWVEETWKKVEEKLSVVAVRSKDKIPFWSNDGMHDDCKDDRISCWTNGFWPGLMWLMYAATKDDRYRETAEHIEDLLDVAFMDYYEFSHDMGFIWRISSGASYQLTGNEKSKIRQSIAADHLMARFNPTGGFIRAWNPNPKKGLKKTGWVIIDTMMNLPLLYWASEEYEDPRFKDAAMRHADTTMRNIIRPDGSVRHIAEHDPATGEFIREYGGQGYGEGSAWSRGQAWAVYGFVLSYLHTGKEEYLITAKRVAHYFIASVCEDWLPKQDFRSPEDNLYDSSAGYIAACGLIELAKIVPQHEKKLYINSAMKLLMTMEKAWVDWSCDTDFITSMSTGTYVLKNSYNTNIIYADYYFVEALYKLKELGPLFW